MLVKRYQITSIPSLNEALQGGLGEESMLQIYGPYQAGKTLLSLQLIYEVLSKDKVSSLYIDIESSLKNNFIVEDRLSALNRRFNFELEVGDVAIERKARSKSRRRDLKEIRRVFETVLDELEIAYDEEDLEDALKAFLKEYEMVSTATGRSGVLHILDGVQLIDLYNLLNIRAELTSVGRKVEVKVREQGDPTVSPLSKFIRKHRVKVVVIDSLGSLLKHLSSGLSDPPAP
jgi:RecA/RadA recombinase